MLGVIGGTGIIGEKRLTGQKRWIKGPYGEATLLVGEKIAFLPRHGLKADIPPHQINHRANIDALKRIGIKEIIGINSVGSLKESIRPPAILIPQDYMNISNVPTFFDTRIKHITPGIDDELRGEIVKAANKHNIRIIENGVYIQTMGPRLETKAEINMLKNFGDVIGMTMASEATLAKELGIRYASICSVDNYAHGIIKEELDFEKVIEKAGVSSDMTVKLVKVVSQVLK